MNQPTRTQEFDDALFELIFSIVEPGDEIETLASKRPNRIVSIDRCGIEVETLRSDDRGTGPQMVPAWMIIVAWEHLLRHRQLTQNELLNRLNVKRSAFVCALLALLPGVTVRSTRPTMLELSEDSSAGLKQRKPSLSETYSLERLRLRHDYDPAPFTDAGRLIVRERTDGEHGVVVVMANSDSDYWEYHLGPFEIQQLVHALTRELASDES
ncbi:hypothetical protein [Mycobacterium sp. IS-1590]|uniref:hypothetical protein n=1 Tax=Mycobacterium sp. IS-1590 TaxID=1772286 RepID=UPI000A85DFD4|nr:hypothetical protein [Mycobacterium sp. IS-1590]